MDELNIVNRYVMPELRDKAYRRLSSIEGQIRGLKKSWWKSARAWRFWFSSLLPRRLCAALRN